MQPSRYILFFILLMHSITSAKQNNSCNDIYRFEEAVRKNSLSEVQSLLNTDFDINQDYFMSGGTALKMAIATEAHLPIIAALLNHPAMKINHQSAAGRTALMIACEKGQNGTVPTILLEHGADPLIVDEYGNNALYYAYHNYQQSLLYKKLNIAAKKTIKYHDAIGKEEADHPIQLLVNRMAKKGKKTSKIIRAIEQQYSKNLAHLIQEMTDASSPEIRKILREQMASNRSYNGMGEISHALLLQQLGITITQKPSKIPVQTVLFTIASLDTIRFLLQLPVDMTMVDEEGYSPLYYLYADYQERLNWDCWLDVYRGRNTSAEAGRAIDECKTIIILILQHLIQEIRDEEKQQQYLKQVIREIETQYSRNIRTIIKKR